MLCPPRRPLVRRVEVPPALFAVVNPADPHPRPNTLTPRLRSDTGKRSFAIVAVKILPSEIVNYVKIGPAIAIEVVPAATKAVASVVLIKPSLGGYVAKRTVAVITHHEIGRPVLRVVIRRRILVLVSALVIDVEAKVDIQPSVAVIVRNRCSGERPLPRICELKRVPLLAKPAAAFIQRQLRARAR